MDIIRFTKIPRRAPTSKLGNKENLSRRESGIHLGKVGGVCVCVRACKDKHKDSEAQEESVVCLRN